MMMITAPCLHFIRTRSYGSRNATWKPTMEPELSPREEISSARSHCVGVHVIFVECTRDSCNIATCQSLSYCRTLDISLKFLPFDTKNNILQRRLSCLQTLRYATWQNNAKQHARALFFVVCQHFTSLVAAVAETGIQNILQQPSLHESSSQFITTNYTICSLCHPKSSSVLVDVKYFSHLKVMLSGQET